jgi:acyl dehydratase
VSAASPATAGPAASAGGAATTPGWADLPEGAAPAPRTDRPLTVTDFVRYQGASGDLNPIHHDDAFARAAGYPGPFAVGMLAAGRLAAYAVDWLGPRNIRRYGVRFREQAWPGDVLTYTGVVTARHDAGGQRSVDVELVCARQTGGVHLTGWATFVVPEA